MRVLIGTTNPSKIDFFARMLADTCVQIETPRDAGVLGEPTETGCTPVENARIKAAYYGRFAPYVICADSGLYLEPLPLDDPRQPGLHVRTPGGRARLDDEQMISYYAALAHSFGGRVVAYYMDGCAVRTPSGVYSFETTREEAQSSAFVLLDMPCAQRRKGWPLDSLATDLSGQRFLDPTRPGQTQMKRVYTARMRRFLLESLGLTCCEALSQEGKVSMP